MRITKEFLNDCAFHARQMIGKAKEKTENAFFNKLSEDTFLIPLIKPFGSAEFKSFIAEITSATKLGAEDALYLKEIKNRVRDSVLSTEKFAELGDSRRISADLVLTPEADSKLGQKLPNGLTVPLNQLLGLREDWKDVLVSNDFIPLTDLIQTGGYYSHTTKKFTYILKDIYTEDELEELYNTFILREEFSEAYDKICKICQRNYRGTEEPYFQYKTLEQFQTDTFVWPIVEGTSIVSNFVEAQEEKARIAKEKREAALREKREREAAARKAQLEAIERGEDPEAAAKAAQPKNEINVTLLKGINKMVN